MPDKRDLNLEKYGISKYRYRELLNFCMQYDEKKARLSSLCSLSSPRIYGAGGTNALSRPTEDTAVKKMKLEKELELIEQCAIEAGEDLYASILDNVARGIKYEYMCVPCGRRQFYEMRRLFFCLLSERR